MCSTWVKKLGKRGARPFEEKVGEDKFKALIKRLTVAEIAALYCDHYPEEHQRAKCHTCHVKIYRAKKRVEAKAKKGKRLDPIETFDLIPEIQSFIDHMKAKGVEVTDHMQRFRRMWSWIREDAKLKNTQRPALWDTPHIKHILKKLREIGTAPYHHKQTLRRFYESMGKEYAHMLKHPLLGASTKDMKSSKPKRKITTFTPLEVPKILQGLTEEEQLTVQCNITMKSREKSLLATEWDAINWKDTYYGFPMATITIYEPKTKGGTYWEHCPLDLWFADLSKKLKAKWERLGCPSEGKIFDMTYEQYRKLWIRISKKMGRKMEAHDCRRSVGSWLRDLGLTDLALGQYSKLSDRAVGFTGVGWENATIYYQRYGKRNPLTIYDKKMRLELTVFAGFIHKIMENK